MPESKAQLRFINAAAARGDVKQSVADEFNKATKKIGYKNLPERVGKKKKGLAATMSGK